MNLKYAAILFGLTFLAFGCGEKEKSADVTQQGELEIDAFADQLEGILREGSEDKLHELIISLFPSQEDYRLILSEEISDRSIEEISHFDQLILDMMKAGTHKPGGFMLEEFRSSDFQERTIRSYSLEQLVEAVANSEEISHFKKLAHWAEDEFFKPETVFYEVRFTNSTGIYSDKTPLGAFFWNGESWKMMHVPLGSEIYIETEAMVRNGRASEYGRKKALDSDLSVEDAVAKKNREGVRESIASNEAEIKRLEVDLEHFINGTGRYQGIAEMFEKEQKRAKRAIAKFQTALEKAESLLSALRDDSTSKSSEISRAEDKIKFLKGQLRLEEQGYAKRSKHPEMLKKDEEKKREALERRKEMLRRDKDYLKKTEEKGE